LAFGFSQQLNDRGQFAISLGAGWLCRQMQKLSGEEVMVMPPAPPSYPNFPFCEKGVCDFRFWAQKGHAALSVRCSLAGLEQTLFRAARTSENDPERTCRDDALDNKSLPDQPPLGPF
jgi:hypothetical protein